MTSPEWIDIHTHLNMLEGTPEEVLEAADLNEVKKIITIGTEPEDHSIVLGLAQKFYPKVFCTLGVHPHEAAKYTDECEKFLEANLPDKSVVGVGEIGLDYFYNNAEPEVQKRVFNRQMELAKRHKLPVEVHTRDAEDDTAEIIKEFEGSVKGVLHCFTGSMEMAKKALNSGWNISFSGIVTFKSAADLREVAKMVPIDRLHVETDAPFLTPVPHRGKKNSPAMVIHTAKVVAELKNVSLLELSVQTKKNAMTLFPKLSWN